jgi:hypothetical protein
LTSQSFVRYKHHKSARLGLNLGQTRKQIIMTEETNSTPAPEAPKAKRTRGKNKPVQGKFGVEFLAETVVPDRKPLQGGGNSGPRDTVMSDILKALNEHKGQLGAVFTSPDREEVFKRRVTLVKAAERLGIKLDLKNTASRAFVKNGAPVTGPDGKELYALYARVLTDDEATALAAEEAAKAEAAKAATPAGAGA